MNDSVIVCSFQGKRLILLGKSWILYLRAIKSVSVNVSSYRGIKQIKGKRTNAEMPMLSKWQDWVKTTSWPLKLRNHIMNWILNSRSNFCRFIKVRLSISKLRWMKRKRGKKGLRQCQTGSVPWFFLNGKLEFEANIFIHYLFWVTQFLYFNSMNHRAFSAL